MDKFICLEVSGNHKDLGKAIGAAFKTKIRERIRDRHLKIPSYERYLSQTEPYFKETKHYFPQLIQETEAIAASAGVPVPDYFFMNCREVYNFFFDETEFDNDRCTIAVGIGKNGPIVGHNEDWDVRATDELYLLKATINGTTIFGLNNKVLIPGDVANVNSYGLVQCINEVHIQIGQGVPKNYLARAVIECKTINQAENLLRKTRRASGFNHVLVQKNRIDNIEIVGDLMCVTSQEFIPFAHANHLLSPALQKYENLKTESSVARYNRANELIGSVKSVEDMRKLLSDHKNQKFPICRHDATMGSVIFDPSSNTAWICYGLPCQNEFIRYNIT